MVPECTSRTVSLLLDNMLHSLLRTYMYHRVSKDKKATRLLPHMDQQLHNLPEHLSSGFGFSEVRVVLSLVFGVICFILLFFHFFLSLLPLYGLFLELRLLITLLVAVNHCIFRFFCSLFSLHFFDLRLLITFSISLNFSCKSLYVIFRLVIVLSDLPRLTTSRWCGTTHVLWRGKQFVIHT